MKAERSFLMLECRQPTCRFRFPVEVTLHKPELACPVCKGELKTVAAEVGSRGENQRSPQPQRRVSGLLDNIRSIHNVGSMFRSADGAGMDHLHLCGMTATPDHPKLAKAALGAQQTIPWSYHRNALHTAISLKERGHLLWAVEALPGAAVLPVTSLPKPPSPVVLIVGHEKAGVDPAILAQCDQLFALPMSGIKQSLNVAVAFGIAAYLFRFAG